MRPSRGRLVAFLLLSVAQTLSAGVVHAAPFQLGDIFAAVGDSDLNGTSEVRRYNAAGVLQETLQLTGASNRSTGMAFDSAGNLYATGFDSNVVKKFDSNGALLGNFGSGYATPESIVFDNAGNVYVSNVSDGGIRKFDAAGNFITTILPGVRVDWMDLAADQTTMLYSQEGSPILRVNVSTNTADRRPFVRASDPSRRKRAGRKRREHQALQLFRSPGSDIRRRRRRSLVRLEPQPRRHLLLERQLTDRQPLRVRHRVRLRRELHDVHAVPRHRRAQPAADSSPRGGGDLRRADRRLPDVFCTGCRANESRAPRPRPDRVGDPCLATSSLNEQDLPDR